MVHRRRSAAPVAVNHCGFEVNTKQQVFVEEYLKCWNATEAARRAGYSEKSIRSIAAENLTKPDIKAEIEARLAEMKMSADEVLTLLSAQARADMADFVKFQEGVKLPFLDLKGAAEKGLLKLVKKFKYNAAGHPEIELYDAQAALVHIGKVHGLFTEKVEHSGDVGLKIEYVNNWRSPSQDES